MEQERDRHECAYCGVTLSKLRPGICSDCIEPSDFTREEMLAEIGDE